MDYHSFIGQIQHRARLGTTEDAIHITRATLSTLGERLLEDEKKDLAAQLPRELQHYLEEVESGQKFTLDEFIKRICDREGNKANDAMYHMRVVFEVLQEAVSAGEMDQVKDQLPEDFAPFFEAGSSGKLNA